VKRRFALLDEERPSFQRAISPGERAQPQRTDPQQADTQQTDSREQRSEQQSKERSETRSEGRSDVQLAVTVYGFATTGKLFVEHCSTRNVSHSGCCVHLRTQPQADTALALRLLRWGLSAKGAAQLLYQVVWVQKDGNGWLVGASSLGPADLYSLAFPGTP
jgi:PilZ domain